MKTCLFPCLGLIPFLCLHDLVAVDTSRVPEPILGDPLAIAPEALQKMTAPSVASALAEGGSTDPVVGFSVDIQDRTDVLVLYHEVYRASEGYETRIAWTGDVASCLAGDISEAFRDDTRRRINYYRALVGLPANITFNSAKSAKAQAAALIYAANQGLSHFPIRDFPQWSCLSADGDDAGQHGNIALGTFGPGSVDAYIRDNGGNNAAVGHRRWLLYPPAVEMGSGSIPPGPYGSSANAIWVIGDFGSRPALPEWTSWPPPGYVPYSQVPSRWSFSMPGATFAGTTVTMTCDGNPVTVVKETVSNGIGDNTLVWLPQSLSTEAPDPDRSYTVTLANVTVGGSSRTFSYEVTAMDPFNLAQTVSMSGPAEPYIGADNRYAFTPISHASEYELRSARAVTGSWTEGAEANPTPRVIDGTASGYSLFTATVKRTGSRSFHLTFPTFNDNDQTLTIDRSIIPGPTSVFQYYSRFRFASTTSHLAAEISADNGNRWTELSSRSGNGSTSSGGWESSWVPTSVSLADYAGQVVLVRVRFHYDPFTSVFLGTDDNTGVFVDDITVTAARELTDISLSPVAADADSITFHPPVMGEYFLAMQPRVGGVWFGFGPALVVQANQTEPPTVQIAGVMMVGGMVVMEFTVSNPSSASFHLLKSATPDGSYGPDGSAVLSTLQAGVRYRFTVMAGGDSGYYRVSMD